MPDPEMIRLRLREHLGCSPRGEMTRIARIAGLSACTMSKFVAGSYSGRTDLVADRIAEMLGSIWAANKLLSGDGRINWIVITDKGLKVARMPKTRDALAAEHPEALILTVVLGATPQESIFYGPDVWANLEKTDDRRE